MNFKVGDEVVVITGSDKGKKGKIIKTLKNENKVIVEGVHIVKKHQKPTGNETGGIIYVTTRKSYESSRQFWCS